MWKVCEWLKDCENGCPKLFRGMEKEFAPFLSKKVIKGRSRDLYSRRIDINDNNIVSKKATFQEEMKELFEICSFFYPSASCQDVRCKQKSVMETTWTVIVV